jgi:hypothetical protein
VLPSGCFPSGSAKNTREKSSRATFSLFGNIVIDGKAVFSDESGSPALRMNLRKLPHERVSASS